MIFQKRLLITMWQTFNQNKFHWGRLVNDTFTSFLQNLISKKKKKYFHQKYFHQKYFHQKFFCQKIFLKKYTNYFEKKCFVKNISEKIFHHKYLRKKYFHKKYFRKNTLTTIFLKKGGGEAPLLPAGPRLISSDNEISA